MSRQRPTFQLAEWRVATHLSATRRVQNDPDAPAYRCECMWCAKWHRHYADLLPVELLSQFTRIGIQPNHPMDLYNYESDSEADYLRVIFGFVGRVMTGPDAWISHDSCGPQRSYQTLRFTPFLSLVVHKHEDLHYAPPASYDIKEGHYLLADFRLAMPFTLSAASTKHEQVKQTTEAS